MAYDAPCGGSGRYARPAVSWLARGTCRCEDWPMMRRAVASGRYARPAVPLVRLLRGLWPRIFSSPLRPLYLKGIPMMRRVAVADAARALRCPGWHEIEV
eukprot:184388-Prymnesium_polylepis.1